MNCIKKIAYVFVLLLMTTGAAWGMDIFEAAETGNIGRIEELLAIGADVNQQGRMGKTALHLAAAYGHDAIVARLIQADAGVNQQDGIGLTPLHFAAAAGYEAVVHKLIRAGALVNQQDGTGRTPLHWAALYCGSQEAFSMLIEAGADLDIQDNTGRTPRSLDSKKQDFVRTYSRLYQAQATHDSVQQPPVAQQDEPDVLPQETVEQRGSSELNPANALDVAPRVASTVPAASAVPPITSEMDIFQAAQNGNIERIKELLARGADVNQRDNFGLTALHCAALNGHEAVVSMLIEAGADISLKNNLGRTALHAVARNGHEAIASRLIEAGANPDIQDNTGRTPISVAEDKNNQKILSIFSRSHQAQATHDFVQQPPVAQQDEPDVLPQETVEQRGSSKLNPGDSHAASRVALAVSAASAVLPRISDMDIFQAAATGNIGRIEELLANGADVNQQDDEGWTPLHYAALYGHEAVVSRLIEARADIDRKENAGGCTALHFAAMSGYGQVVLRLIEAGADPDIKDNTGRTPISAASKNPGILSIFSRPRHAQATMDIFRAAETGNIGRIEELLANGVNINQQDNDGDTPLHLAAMHGHEQIVHRLIQADAGVNQQNNTGLTALHLAAMHGHEAVVLRLIQAGAFVNRQNNIGMTPLHLAAKQGHKAVVLRLIEAKAVVNQRNCDGKTALGLALQYGHQEISTILSRLHHAQATHDSVQKPPVAQQDEPDVLPQETVEQRGSSKLNPGDSHAASRVALAVSAASAVLPRISADEKARIKAHLDKYPYAAATIEEKSGNTPIHIAAQNGEADICSIIIDAYTRFRLAEKGKTCVQALSEQVDFINLKNKCNETALDLALKGGHIEVVKLLLKYGCTDEQGYNFLHKAIMTGNEHNVDIFIKAGMSVDQTVLQLAQKFSNHKIYDKLIAAKSISSQVQQSCQESSIAGIVPAQEPKELTVEQREPHEAETDSPDVLGRTLLHRAVEAGLIEEVNSLVARKVDLEEVDIQDRTPFNLAVEKGNADIVRALIDAGADINHQDERHWSPLYCAAHFGHQKVVQLLVQHGADINQQNSEGTSLLHKAVSSNDEQAVNVILQCNGAVDVQDKKGVTPLYLAAEKGCGNLVKILIQHGSLLVNQNPAICEFLPLLIQHGIDVNKPGADGMTLLHRAVLNHDIKATEMLLAHKALVDSKDNEEKTALHHAIFWQDIEIAKKLIGCKAQVNAKNKHGQTPLHVAAFTGDRALIELLSQHGADINAKDEQGNTPLHVAVINDQQDIIELLIKLGAQLTSLNKCEETPVYSAARNGFQDIFNILRNHCVVDTADLTGTYVHRAALNGHVEAIKMFIAAGVDIDKPSLNGSTALHKAVRNHKTDAVQLLLQLKADPNITDGRGLTPLHCAIEENDIEAAEILVKQGASIFKAFKNVPSALNFALEKHNREMIKMIAHYHQDILHYTVVQNDIKAATMLLDFEVPVDSKNSANKTPLYIAAERGYEEMAKFLLRRGANIACQELSISQFLLFLKKQGADINQTNEEGQTLLHLAAIANDIDSVKRLLESGAHIDQQDNHNKSPLHIAVEGQRRSLVDLLLESGANVNLKDDTGSTPLYKASMLRETWIRGKLACFGGNLA